jgi:hypothetical protein
MQCDADPGVDRIDRRGEGAPLCNATMTVPPTVNNDVSETPSTAAPAL